MALRYIEANPATQAFNEGMDRASSRASVDFNLDEGMRRSAEQQNVDTATRAGLRNVFARNTPQPTPVQTTPTLSAPSPAPAQPTPGSPASMIAPPPTPQAAPSPAPAAAPAAPAPGAVRQDQHATALRDLSASLANVQGGGQAAMQAFNASHQQSQVDQRRQDEQERAALIAIAKGDRPTFDFLVQRHGLQFPPDMVNSMATNGNFARGMLISEKIYRDDPQQAQKFIAAFAQSGNLETAFATVGPPRTRPNIGFQQVRQADQLVTYLVDRNAYKPGAPTNTYMQEVGRGQAPMGAGGGAGGAAAGLGGRITNQYQMSQAIGREIALERGEPFNYSHILEAQERLAQARVNPGALRAAAVQWARTRAENDRTFRALPGEEQIRQATQELMASMSAGGAPGGGGPAEIPGPPMQAPRPGEPAPAPAAPAAARPSLRDFTVGGAGAFNSGPAAAPQAPTAMPQLPNYLGGDDFQDTGGTDEFPQFAPTQVTPPAVPYMAPRPTDAPIRGSMVLDRSGRLVPAPP